MTFRRILPDLIVVWLIAVAFGLVTYAAMLPAPIQQPVIVVIWTPAGPLFVRIDRAEPIKSTDDHWPVWVEYDIEAGADG